MVSHPHKPIFYPSNYYYRSNAITLTWNGNQMEDYTTNNCLECHQYADHDIIINRRRSVSGTIHTLLGIYVCWKVQIQPAVASDSTDGEIRFMYMAFKKHKDIRRYKKSSEIHMGAPTVHWEYNTSCIYVVEGKRVTPRVKHIGIPV